MGSPERVAPAPASWADLLAEGRAARFLLICLGVWLSASDNLVTSTIMPSVGRDIGGWAYFSWATAGFLVGAILAGASAGRLSEIIGLRTATALAGLVMAAGAVLSAMAPGVGLFLLGRLAQGLGAGWISGFAMVAVAFLFPERHLARVFASVSFVWGIATLLGPLIGGIVVETGQWRDVFWLFAAQALLFSLAAPVLLGVGARKSGGPGIPWTQLAVLGAGVGAIAAADMTRAPQVAGLLVAAGLAILLLVVRIDARARIRLLPHRAGDLTTVCGAGYLSMFALTAASAITAVRQTGAAVGAAISGVAANLAGFSAGVTSATARATSFWVFAAVIPLALLGTWAAFRLTGRSAND